MFSSFFTTKPVRDEELGTTEQYRQARSCFIREWHQLIQNAVNSVLAGANRGRRSPFANAIYSCSAWNRAAECFRHQRISIRGEGLPNQYDAIIHGRRCRWELICIPSCFICINCTRRPTPALSRHLTNLQCR